MAGTKRNRAQQDAELPELTGPQLRAADLLATGSTDAEAAEEAGVSRQTVWRWRQHNPVFRAALASRREEIWGAARDRLRSLLPKALEVLEGELAGDPDGDRPPNWHAALALLRLGGLSGADLSDPGDVTSAEEILEAEARQRREPDDDDEIFRRIANGQPGPVSEKERRAVLKELREAGAFEAGDEGGPDAP